MRKRTCSTDISDFSDLFIYSEYPRLSMAKKTKEDCCSGCCRIEAMVTVDERGQMVLPKDVRDAAGISAGDKMALVSLKREDKICCISLIPAVDFASTVKDMLGPMLEEMVRGSK
jgi:AbrB family looped-hinge helix DNA binding protein